MELRISKSEFEAIKVMKSLKRIDFSLLAVQQLGHDVPDEVREMRAKLEIMEKCERNANCSVVVFDIYGNEERAFYEASEEAWYTRT